MNRRSILLGGAAVLVGGGATISSLMSPGNAAGTFEITRTDAEWRRLLTAAQYNVLRKQGTERPRSSALDHEGRAGQFACAG